LLEVLVAIFITGVALLALLTLFPLGIMDLAQAIKDDRADALAADAVALSQDGLDLLSRTEDFLSDSLAAGSADPQAAAELRMEYEALGAQAADLEARLIDLGPLIQTPKLRRQFLASLAQIKAIQEAAKQMVELLRILEDPNFP
jgi:hypothetical protein